jgi:CBS-domain-containing membrane protein
MNYQSAALRELQPYRQHMTSVSLNYTLWPESASELYRPRDSRLSEKLVPTFADTECHVVSVTDPHGRILGF